MSNLETYTTYMTPVLYNFITATLQLEIFRRTRELIVKDKG